MTVGQVKRDGRNGKGVDLRKQGGDESRSGGYPILEGGVTAGQDGNPAE